MNYSDSITFKYNVNSNGDPISVRISEEIQQVSPITNFIQLTQIPDEFQRVVVKNIDNSILREIFDIDKLTEMSYKVDYSHGIVYFNYRNAGKTFKFDYYGRGVELIHASRIVIDDNPMNYETLQQLSSKASEIVDSVNKAEVTFTENEKVRQHTFVESEVNRNSEELKRQLAEKERYENYTKSEENRDSLYATAESFRNNSFELDQSNRNDEYQIWKNLVMDEQNVVRLQAQIDEIKAILSQVPRIEITE